MAEPITINLRHVARGLNLPLPQVEAVVELLDEGNTVPFITRYRKDQTGGLDEEKIRAIQANLAKARLLAERKQTILRSIQAQGKLTEELAKRIEAASTMKRLEDLYLPYKPKKQSLATLARSRGLELLAQEILLGAVGRDELDARARDFANPDRQVPTAADALLGAGHILAEQFSENAELRQRLREVLSRTGRIVSTRCAAEGESAQAPEPPRPAKSEKRKPGGQAAGRQSPGPTAEPPQPASPSGSFQHSESTQTSQLSQLESLTPPSGAEGLKDSQQAAGISEKPAHVAPEASEGGPGPGESAAGRTENPQQSAQKARHDPPQARPADAPAQVVSPPATEAAPTPSSSGEGASGPGGGLAAQPTSDGSPALRPSPATTGEASAKAAPPDAELSDAEPSVAADSPASAQTAGQNGPALASPEAVVGTPAEASPPEAAPSTSVEASSAMAGVASSAGKGAKSKSLLSKAELKRLQKQQRKKKAEERRLKAFADYFQYSEAVRRIPPHRVLAINRGERARILRVKIECDLEEMYRVVDEVCVPPEHPHGDFLRGCARDALVRLILPSLEREIRRELTEQAESHAVGVFARNLRKLLLQPPVRDRRVLAIDPGFTSGCKMVALDQFGNVLGHDTFYLVGKPERREEAKRKIAEMIDHFQLDTIAIGNGTASRQTEEFVAQLLGNELKGRNVAYVVVNEAGASVYSTSRIGREEFPQYDAAVRGAISIGRRLLDPLSELVKIEPANLGVGLYQHDLKANHLRESLDAVVESCVNYVGVDVNTASPALLRYVSGLNQLTAWRLYEYRVQNGPFRSRQHLRQVPGIGEATFIQSAGFLKIVGGDNPLDATWIHPESYEIAGRVMAKLGIGPSDLANRDASARLAERIAKVNRQALAEELQVGRMTLDDILTQLLRPGRDPREDLPRPIFKHGVLKLEDLTVGMELSGTVLNVVDFGAFVDIGMHDCGLVHVSQIADRFVRDPHELLAVGDVVKVWVLDVDKDRRRVSLTMIPPGQARRGAHRAGSSDRPATASSQGQGSQGQAPSGRPRQDQGPGGTSRPGRTSRTPSSARSEGTSGQGGTGGHARPPFVHRPSKAAGGPSGPPAPPRPKPPPKPLTPLTEEMKSGKEPLRSFSDLLQFYELQHGKLSRPEEGQKSQDSPRRSDRSGRGRRNKRAKPSQTGGQPAQARPDSPDRPEGGQTPSQAPELSGQTDSHAPPLGSSPGPETSPMEGKPALDAEKPAGQFPAAVTEGESPAAGAQTQALDPAVLGTSPAAAAATEAPPTGVPGVAAAPSETESSSSSPAFTPGEPLPGDSLPGDSDAAGSPGSGPSAEQPPSPPNPAVPRAD